MPQTWHLAEAGELEIRLRKDPVSGKMRAVCAGRDSLPQASLAGKVRIKKAEQIGKEVQPKQAQFHHGPMSFVFGLLRQINSNVVRFKSLRYSFRGQMVCDYFSGFPLKPVVFAEHDRWRS
jgi:hypothetical protein